MTNEQLLLQIGRMMGDTVREAVQEMKAYVHEVVQDSEERLTRKIEEVDERLSARMDELQASSQRSLDETEEMALQIAATFERIERIEGVL
ncbi:hypothetical protein OS242_13155 [Tumebacillus sp. DT12]|uniref:DUF3782 domain-containing protein n=1 Tax=Tumebacillus lacus TaxID=2995335 RepID=A0ABT3X4X8_9BACL|nr:hypothetical protein [Tumebacillus lacus]MCX7570892.1 hypothetical protein [Tumebacillus lacus]